MRCVIKRLNRVNEGSLTESTSIAGHYVVVFLFPRRHVSRYSLSVHGGSSFLHRVFVSKLLIGLIVGLEVLRILLAEDFRVLGQVLLIGSPFLFMLTFGMVHITHVKVDSADVIVINSVLNVFHILMSLGETSFSKVVDELLLGVLSSVFNTLVDAVNDLTEILFGLFTVDLR